MLPALAYGLSALYVGGRLMDTARFWRDYQKNTGYSPRYPFLRGPGQSIGMASSAFSGLKRL